MQFKYICKLWCCEKKNVKKIGQFSETNILRTTEVISFSFDMWSSVYVKQKMHKFGRNQLSSFGDISGRLNLATLRYHTCALHIFFVFLVAFISTITALSLAIHFFNMAIFSCWLQLFYTQGVFGWDNKITISMLKEILVITNVNVLNDIISKWSHTSKGFTVL